MSIRGNYYMKNIWNIIKNLINKDRVPTYTRPNMNNLKGRHGRAILNEIRSMKTPRMDDVRQEANECMRRILEDRRYARKSIAAVEKEQCLKKRQEAERRFIEEVMAAERSIEDGNYVTSDEMYEFLGIKREDAMDELRDVDLYVKRLYEQIKDNGIVKEDIDYLRYKLHIVADAYSDFEIALLAYATKSTIRLRKTICYLVNHPEAKSSDVIEYVSNQPEFWEDV